MWYLLHTHASNTPRKPGVPQMTVRFFNRPIAADVVKRHRSCDRCHLGVPHGGVSMRKYLLSAALFERIPNLQPVC